MLREKNDTNDTAQAMYSLSQDNVDFKRKITSEPAALDVLAKAARDAPAPAPKAEKEKSKTKSKKESKHEEQDQDLQTLLKLLICGTSPILPGLQQMRADFLGVLRNVVDTGSDADEVINIVSITNEVALPIINTLLNLDTTRTVNRVFELVREAVSCFFC